MNKPIILLCAFIISLNLTGMELTEKKLFDLRQTTYYQLLSPEQSKVISAISELDKQKISFGIASLLHNDKQVIEIVSASLLKRQFSQLPGIDESINIHLLTKKKSLASFFKNVEYTALQKFIEEENPKKKQLALAPTTLYKEVECNRPWLLGLGTVTTLFTMAALPEKQLIQLGALGFGIVTTVYASFSEKITTRAPLDLSKNSTGSNYIFGSHSVLAYENYQLVHDFNNAPYKSVDQLMLPSELNK